MGWQDDARRTVVSEKKALSTLEGYWVKVRLWTVGGKDEITATVRKLQKGLDKKSLISFMAKARSRGKDLTNEADIMSILTEDEIAAFVDSESVEASAMIEAKLKNGIAEHNFGDMKVSELAHDLLEFPNVAEEILKLIEDFNRPLASQTSSTSATSPSGSTTEQNLSTATPSPTEATPQS